METRESRLEVARVPRGHIKTGLSSLESSLHFAAILTISALQIGCGDLTEVQISLDFIQGQRSIVTFRFSAGDTMMWRRIYASRGM